ncbi:MAG: G1 family glutamic endopeptidase, partial [Gaiellaceae bacterium]
MNRRTPRTHRLAAVALAALATGCALAAGSASAATPTVAKTRAVVTGGTATSQTSTNWAGYAITSSSQAAKAFTSVSGRWVQPSVDCTQTSPAFAAFWIGLGGFSAGSQALEQIGTQASCDPSGGASYSIWYEVIPAPSVPIPLTVEPGDTVAAGVTIKRHTVTLTIRDLTKGTSFRKQLHMAVPDGSSAEWIAEAPSACDGRGGCQVVPLADFGSVAFTNAATRVAGHLGTIFDFAWTPTAINLQSDSAQPVGNTLDQSSSTVSAITSPVSSDGRSFSVSW